MTESDGPDLEKGSRWGALLAVAAIIGITAFTFGADLLMSEQPPRPQVPQERPSLRDEDSPTVIFDRSSRLTVIRFWSTTCAGCRNEIDQTSELARDLPDVRFIAVAVDEDTSAGSAWAGLLAPPVVAVSDPERLLARALEVSAVPSTVILDRNRTVVRRFNAVDANTLRSVLAARRDALRGQVRQRVGLRSGGQ